MKKSPFQLLLDTDTVYWGRGLKAVWEEVTRYLGNGQSPQFIQGKSGSGKTLFLHLLALRSIELGHNCAYIDAAERKADLFESLSQAYGLDYPTKSEEQYLTWFESYLASSRLGGVQNVLLLDNLHRLDEQALQKLVYLVRIRIDNTPLLHVVTTLDMAIAPSALATLEGHKVHFNPLTLSPLGEQETADYLQYRLRQAGHPDGDLFAPEVVRWIHTKSQGLPREINFYADLLLTHAFLKQRPRVEESLIKVVDPAYAVEVRLRPVTEENLVVSSTSPESAPSSQTQAPLSQERADTDEEAAASSPEESPIPDERAGQSSRPGTSTPGGHTIREDEPRIDSAGLDSLVDAVDESNREGGDTRSSGPPSAKHDGRSKEPPPPRNKVAEPANASSRWAFLLTAAALLILLAGVVLFSGRDRHEPVRAETASPVETAPVLRAQKSEDDASSDDRDSNEAGSPASAPSPQPDETAEQKLAKRTPVKEAVEPPPSAQAEETKKPAPPREPRVAVKPPTPVKPVTRKEPVSPAPAPKTMPATTSAQDTPTTATASRLAKAEPPPSPEPATAMEDAKIAVPAENASEFASFTPPDSHDSKILPLAALDKLVSRFQWAYENGDENLLADLFDPAIRTNESEGRDNIIGEYRQFFSITQARRLEIGPVVWQTSGTTATGVAHFTAHVVTSKGRERTFTGTLTIEARSTPRGLRITALFYRYDG